MMFDGTVSRLNYYLCDPNSMFMSMGSFLMIVGPETHMVDLDVGEIFYNLQLSSVLSKYCGVDLGSYLGREKERQGTLLWMC